MKTYKRTPAEIREDVINAIIIFLVLGIPTGVYAWFKF